MKGTFPIDKFRELRTPFYYYDTKVLRSISFYICTFFFLLFFVEQCITKRLQCLILVALTDKARNVVVTTTK